MPALLTGDVNLTPDLFACVVVLALIAVVLLTGWITRTTAVVWVSIFLLCLGCLVLGTWLAYRLDAPDGPVTPGLAVLRLIGGAAAILLVVAIWVLVKLVRRDATMRPTAEDAASPSTPPVEQYDRDWMLSLLQTRAAKSKEKIANGPHPAADPENSRTNGGSETSLS